MNNNTIFIFGGSFDPIHNGHMAIIKSILKYSDPGALIIVPCKQSVFKEKPLFSAQQRISFIKAACSQLSKRKQKKILISNYELDASEPSYTVNTLQYIINTHKPSEKIFVLVMGSDSYKNFEQWYNYKKILEIANLLIIDRDQIISPTQFIKFQNRSGEIKHLNIGLHSESSTEIRKIISSTSWSQLDCYTPKKVINLMRKTLTT